MATSTMGTTAAQAADLGGDCCADLEERVAELEATTARKGNRKVKLEVSGHVNEALLVWDDGVESNAGIYTNDASRTRFRFKGDAKIADDWKAGFLIEVGVRGANSKRFSQDDDDGCLSSTDCGLDVRHTVWYIDSKKFGRVWVGLTGGAGESVTEVNLAGTGDVAKYSDVEDMGGGLALRKANGLYSNNTNVVGTGSSDTIRLRRLIRDNGDQPGEGRRYNMVRYDTPEIAGFTGTVNWGEDDTWEMGLKYKGEFSGLKLAAAIAYGETSEPASSGNTIGFACTASLSAGGVADCNQLGGSVSIMHEESGLYANFGAGYMEDNEIKSQAGFGANTIDDDYEFYAGEVGIQRKWMPLGKTTVFGQYYNYDGGAINRNYAVAVRILSSELDIYSLGLMQGIDNAAMNVYAMYRHVESEANTVNSGQLDFQDIDFFMTGAIIKF